MLSLKEPIKMHNSCSYKLLFEKLEDRNIKRITQFAKRKTTLSTKQKGKDKNKIIENKNNPNKKEVKINEKDVINIFNLIINGYNNEIKIEKNIIDNIDNLNINFSKKPPLILNNKAFTLKNTINNNNDNNQIKNSKNNSLINQNKNINNNNKNLLNNSNLTNENANINYDINKEVNISNLEEEKESISNNIHKLNENNEFALKFLSSSNDSFVQLGNNLITKAKIQKNYFTESYSQALCCDLENDIKKFNIKKLDDIETIKEEKEADTPLNKKNKNKINSENSNRLFSMRKKIKLLKEKRKSKSLSKELYLLNKRDNKKNINNIIISIPNKNNKDCEKMFKKAITKIQLSSNKKKNKFFISLNKNTKRKSINNNNYFLKNEEKPSLTQKFSERKMNTGNQTNKSKSLINTDNQFYDSNIKKEKMIQKKAINNNKINDKNNIKKYN